MQTLYVCECGDTLDSGERCSKCGKLGKPQKEQPARIAYRPNRGGKRNAG